MRIIASTSHASARAAISAIVKGAGYEVCECADGAACLSLCRSAPPAVVLLDVIMPDVSGLEVCRRLRQQYPREELPIIIITAGQDGFDVREALVTRAKLWPFDTLRRLLALSPRRGTPTADLLLLVESLYPLQLKPTPEISKLASLTLTTVVPPPTGLAEAFPKILFSTFTPNAAP